jgi:hypothetical protein
VAKNPPSEAALITSLDKPEELRKRRGKEEKKKKRKKKTRTPAQKGLLLCQH